MAVDFSLHASLNIITLKLHIAFDIFKVNVYFAHQIYKKVISSGFSGKYILFGI